MNLAYTMRLTSSAGIFSSWRRNTSNSSTFEYFLNVLEVKRTKILICFK